MGICHSKKNTVPEEPKLIKIKEIPKSIKEIRNEKLQKIISTTDVMHLNSDLLSIEDSKFQTKKKFQTKLIAFKNNKNGKYIGKDKYFTLEQYKHLKNLYESKERIHKLRNKINFTEKDFLGKGAFGIVIKGFDENNKLTMVVKKISLKNKTTHQISQIKKEIKILKKLSHKNIILYFGYEITEKNLLLYLEYAGLKSIDIMLKEYGTFKDSVIKNYTKQILNGLTYLHFKGIIHRDLKGGNVLVNNEGIVKLGDFGCAKNIGSIFKSYAGSIGWMSPEMYKGEPYGRHTDIWSLGCTIYEMCFGTSPFRKNRKKLLEYKEEELFFPSLINNDCKDFIKKCLKNDAKERWNVLELLNHDYVKNVDVNVSGIFKNSLDLITYITMKESRNQEKKNEDFNSLKESMFKGINDDDFYDQVKSEKKKSLSKSQNTEEILETGVINDSIFNFVKVSELSKSKKENKKDFLVKVSEFSKSKLKVKEKYFDNKKTKSLFLKKPNQSSFK